MNKKITILILALLILTLAIPASAKLTPEIKASLLRYDPMPAAQGSTVNVWLKITNLGMPSGNLEVKFVPDYPFTLAPGEDEIKQLGVMPRAEELVVDFDLLVDLYARNQEYGAKFHYKWTEQDMWTEFKAPIEIETTDALLIVSNYILNPKEAAPGDLVEVKLLLKNDGISPVKTADVILDTSDANFFSTHQTGNRKRVGSIMPGEKKEIIFKIMTNSDAEIKLHDLPVKLEYKDEKGQQYSRTSQIGIKMNAPPELIMFIDSTDIHSKRSPGTVRVKLVNKGVTQLKYVTLKLIKTEEYDILSPTNLAYIGNLDNDDFDSAEFIIKPLENDPKLMYMLEFKDPYNRKYTQEFTLPLRIVSKRALGLEKSSLPMVIVLLIIAGIGYWFYKKRKKRKK